MDSEKQLHYGQMWTDGEGAVAIVIALKIPDTIECLAFIFDGYHGLVEIPRSLFQDMFPGLLLDFGDSKSRKQGL